MSPQELLAEALRRTPLTDREAMMVLQRFGVGGGEPLSYREIGRLHGVTGARVQVIIRGACWRMARHARAVLNERHEDGKRGMRHG